MPNGRPGDHPLTDIPSYGSSNYPEDINALVKQLAQMPGLFQVVEARPAHVVLNLGSIDLKLRTLGEPALRTGSPSQS
jgi:hypothetical protein